MDVFGTYRNWLGCMNGLRTSIGLLLVLYSGLAFAQPGQFSKSSGDQAIYEPWQISYSRAINIAKTTRRPVMLVFTGSDWSPECQRWSRAIFQTHEFSSWATENAVKLEVDFPRRHQLPRALRGQNEWLRRKYAGNIRVYPTVIFIDADGKVLGKLEYREMNVDRWIDNAEMLIPARRRAGDLRT